MDTYRRTDICSYRWHMIKGVIMALMIVLLGGFFSVLLGDFVAWIAVMINTGMYLYPELGAATTGVLASFALVCSIIIGGIYLFTEKFHVSLPEPLVESYRAYKEKTCVRVVFHD